MNTDRDRQTDTAPVDRQALIDRVRAAARDTHGHEVSATADGDRGKGPTRRAGPTAPAAPDRAIWHNRLLVAFTTILGAALGVALALSLPQRYEAVSKLLLDPSGLPRTDVDLPPGAYSAETMRALADSQVKTIGSSSVLKTVVEDLDLADDPQFNGTGPAGIAGAARLFRNLLSAGKNEDRANREVLALQSLSRNVSVLRGEDSLIVSISAVTGDPGKSALIANRIADVYIAVQREARLAPSVRDLAALTRQLDVLLADVEAAEQRVAQFRADNDLVGAGATSIDDQRIVLLDRRLAQLRARKAEIQRASETSGALDIDAVLSQAAPEILQASIIGELRAEYAAAKRAAEALANSLGARHPRRIAAEQALGSARLEVDRELRRIARATQVELERIVQSERQLAGERAALKSEQAATSAALDRLRELEREADAASALYRSFLDEAREPRELQERDTGNIRVISEATPPVRPIGPPRLFIAAGGLVLGFAAGLFATMVMGPARSLTPDKDGRSETVVKGPPHPVEALPPAPGHPPRERQEDQIAQKGLPNPPVLQTEDTETGDIESRSRRSKEMREVLDRLQKAREEARVRDTKNPEHAGSTENGVG
ncbi:GumC family protein [Hoeflea poritis]|uniref:GumC family protein n=1 Tax=Hoeflea poritis TaxID=2993659 RepID=A0ABT4VS77_9HYPH|nr:GumC family protein [Hoeflea poritis]MDA4847566.1 GumC family protein [Hoeflea poritis]